MYSCHNYCKQNTHFPLFKLFVFYANYLLCFTGPLLFHQEVLLSSLDRVREQQQVYNVSQAMVNEMGKQAMIRNILRMQQYSRTVDISRRSFCPNCNKHYSCKSALNRHLKLECGKEPQFKCPECTRRYLSLIHI